MKYKLLYIMDISIILYIIGIIFLILSMIELKQYYDKYNEIKGYNKFKKIENGGIVKYIDLDLNNNVIIEYQFNNKNIRTYSLLNKKFKDRLDGIIYIDGLRNKSIDVYNYNDKTYIELNNLNQLGYPISGLLYLLISFGLIYGGYVIGDYFDNFFKNIVKSIIL